MKSFFGRKNGLLRFGAFATFLVGTGLFFDFAKSSHTLAEETGDQNMMKQILRGVKHALIQKITKFAHDKTVGVIIDETKINKKKQRAGLCKKIKEGKEIPSAEKGHSPIIYFGYPHFDEDTKMTTLHPGVSLSYMFGFKQPIKFGTNDFVASGDLPSLVEFSKCFSEYEIKASRLREDGKWVDHDDGFFIQLQDAVPVKTAHGSVKAILFRRAVDQILKNIKPDMIITDGMMEVLPEAVTEFAGGILTKKAEYVQMLEWLPANSRDKAMKLWDDLRNADSFESRLEIFAQYIHKDYSKSHPDWDGLNNVNLEGSEILTLTSYPAPSHGNRATVRINCTNCTMKDVADALEKLLPKKK